MPSTVTRLFSHVRAKWALVHGSNFHMGADMRIKSDSLDSAERAMWAHLGHFSAVIEQMFFQMLFAFVAGTTSVTRKTSRNC